MKGLLICFLIALHKRFKRIIMFLGSIFSSANDAATAPICPAVCISTPVRVLESRRHFQLCPFSFGKVFKVERNIQFMYLGRKNMVNEVAGEVHNVIVCKCSGDYNHTLYYTVVFPRLVGAPFLLNCTLSKLASWVTSSPNHPCGSNASASC